MNLKQLKYFCEVVEAGNANLAARRLFVAPTAISMQIHQMEETLGGRLFDRASRPMSLTALGKFVYPRAKEMLVSMERLTEEAKGISTGNLGWLGIGFTRSTIYALVPEAVRRMKEAYPDIRIDLVEVLTEHQAEAIRNGVIQVGVSRSLGAMVTDPEMAYVPLFDDPMIAAFPAHHPAAQLDSVRAADFNLLPFVSYPKDPQSDFSKHALQLLETAGGKPAIGYEAKEIHTALGLVAAGLGATMVGASVAHNNRTDVRFLPVSDLQAPAKVFAVKRRDEENVLVSAFLAFLSGCAEKFRLDV